MKSFFGNSSSKRKPTYSNYSDSVKMDTRKSRLVSRTPGRSGHINVTYKHRENTRFYAYHQLIDIPWAWQFFYFSVTYLAFNIVFAAIFQLIPNSTAGDNPDVEV